MGVSTQWEMRLGSEGGVLLQRLSDKTIRNSDAILWMVGSH